VSDLKILVITQAFLRPSTCKSQMEQTCIRLQMLVMDIQTYHYISDDP